MNIRQKGNRRSFILALLLILCIGIVFSGCHNPKQQGATAQKNVNLIQLLVGNGDHVFRNVSLGDDPAAIKQAEKKTPDETDTNYMSFSLPMDTLHPDSVNADIDSLNYFTIAYNFDQQKLNEIDEDIFLATDSAASTLQHRFTDYFNSKYGEGVKAPDSMVWSFTKGGKKIKISLSDESEEYDYGKLSLVFYSEDY